MLYIVVLSIIKKICYQDGKASMPEQVKQPNPWRKKIMMMMMIYYQNNYIYSMLCFVSCKNQTLLQNSDHHSTMENQTFWYNRKEIWFRNKLLEMLFLLRKNMLGLLCEWRRILQELFKRNSMFCSVLWECQIILESQEIKRTQRNINHSYKVK
jgi:hypothetical protein